MEDKLIYYGKILVFFQIILLAATMGCDCFLNHNLTHDGISLQEILKQ